MTLSSFIYIFAEFSVHIVIGIVLQVRLTFLILGASTGCVDAQFPSSAIRAIPTDSLSGRLSMSKPSRAMKSREDVEIL